MAETLEETIQKETNQITFINCLLIQPDFPTEIVSYVYTLCIMYVRIYIIIVSMQP